MQHKDPAADLAIVMARECLGSRVAQLHRVVGRRFEQALRPVGLSMAQLEVLASMVLFGRPARPGELAEALQVERSTVSRNLSLMEERGWVAAATSSPTGRSMAVTVTDEGRRKLASARTAWADAQAGAAELLGPRAAGTLDAWLAATEAHG